MKSLHAFVLALFVASAPCALFGDTTSSRFQTIVLSEQFHSEGADVADFNGDGHNDIVSGPYWYEGPEFRNRHAYDQVREYSIKGYSDHFFAFARDFNGDGHVDIFSVPMPGNAGVWFENPGKQDHSGAWKKHTAISSVDNESPTFADITGDGVEELVCIHQGRYGYARPNPDAPTQDWQFTAVSENRGYGRFTHGLGVGDVNGDGKPDLLEKDGWWEQTDTAGAPFKFHGVQFAAGGGSQMFAYDFDGDGDNDVLSVLNAHGYGLSLFESRGGGEEPVFIERKILGSQPAENPYGLAISQMHAVALQDIDGDGVQDIVTGKRFWAHGGNDPGAAELPVLYWFRTVRTKYGVEFQPHLIDVRVGVGTQLTTADVDKNGHVDVVVGNKLGTFVMLNNGNNEPAPQPSRVAPHTVGNDEFRKAIRTTEYLTPEQERQSFVVPQGFEVQLVAAEPDIAKPMNLAFDTKGRLWVSSSSDYPFPAKAGEEGRDTIKILEDTNGDGRADKITTFADKLNIPIGLYPYRDGVICYSIPNIWFLRDTDGDDVCDTREILYGPFDYSRDTHGLCNGFTRGFDGWLYCCHGFNNRSTVAGTDGNQVTLNSGNTFRIRLDGSRIEHFTDGQVNPFGMAIDPNGDLFTADCHTKPITLLMQGGVYEGFGKPHDGLGFVPNVMEHLHGSTAIGGIALYHDDQFPSVFHGNSFGGNVMTSRVNRNSIRHNGASVSAQEESDFLISGDPWFRPVDLQVGPDGALYVADFYNRIIGHYEVDLNHPGRDRDSGRIWRIVYTGKSDSENGLAVRRDVPADQNLRPATASRSDSIDQTIDRLQSANLTERLNATDQLVDQFGSDAVDAIRNRLQNSKDSNVTIHLNWALYRLGVITDADIAAAWKHSDSRVRLHLVRLIGSGIQDNSQASEVLTAALGDPDPMVRRSAALASSLYLSQSLTRQLMNTLKTTPGSDPHLRHAIRMSLRDHLKDADLFRAFTAKLAADEVAIVVDLCLGIKTDFAGEFLAAHVASLQDLDQEKASLYLSFAARYASAEHLKSIAAMSQERFAENADFQEQLVRSVQAGLLERGVALDPVVSQWAAGLARKYLGMKPGASELNGSNQAIGWSYLPYPGTPDSGNPWSLSTSRNSADGEQGSRLHSSFPAGETRTGIYRSESFMLPAEFSFYVAGHDGVPDKPIQNLNLIRIRDAVSQVVLQTWSPPRNDTAQKISWQSGDAKGREVYVELVDGDTGTAYAWMAVGRFSVPGLNPNRDAENRRKAAQLIADFRLTTLRNPVQQILTDPQTGRETLSEFAAAFVALEPSSARAAIAQAFSVRGIDAKLRETLVDLLMNAPSEKIGETLGQVMKIATAAEQQQIASSLSSDRTGLDLLLTQIEGGQASPRLLVNPAIGNKVESLADEAQKQRVAELVNNLPEVDEALLAVMQQRKESYLAGGGNVANGLQLFTKQCGVCHQVAGKGTAVGPNLDGVGNRGLDRLIEDVMTPNRNIDAAFRASVVLTDDGQVVTGMARESDGAQLVIVDQTGKEIRIDKDLVIQQKTVKSSPMPANFHQTFDDDQTKDLLAYLLSLTH